MVTLAEKQAARRRAAAAKFKKAGKKKSTSLSKTAERTAQRRGRGFDPLATVIKTATAPKPPPPRATPPPPPKPKTICDVLGTGPARSGPTFARGVSFGCGNKAIDFTSSANNTTRRVFGAQIFANQAKIRAAGVKFITLAQKNAAKKQVKSLRKQNTSCRTGQAGRRNPSICNPISDQILRISKEFGI